MHEEEKNNFVHGVHMRNRIFNGCKAWKLKRKSKKAWWLKILLPVLLFKKCYLKYQVIKTGHCGPLWDSSLTDKNISDLERVQKTFVKLILEDGFSTYQDGLDTLNIDSL